MLYKIKTSNLCIYMYMSRVAVFSTKIACAPSEDSDQSARIHRLIRVFAVTMQTLCIFNYLQRALQRLCSDFADAQINPSHRWAHMQSCRKCCATVHYDNVDGDK